MLTDRQRREIDHHRLRAEEHADIVAEPIWLSCVTSTRYWWWNAYWVILRQAKNLDLAGKRVLALGCGFGEDAIRLTYLGAPVLALDISAESVVIARQRAAAYAADVAFAVAAAEQLPYADASFDLVYICDVAHHFDIPVAMREIHRVLKPQGVMLANEPYTHTWPQAIRQSRLVRQWLYPRLVGRVYDAHTRPYQTVDERKLDQRDLARIGQALEITKRQYFSLWVGRLPVFHVHTQAIIDRLVLAIPPLGYWLAGRVVVTGRRRQDF